ncbi:hypothetical protein GCM10009087_04880 [Sphingomonas oligophenolica]|uniref:Uncharacterized protein n=1 Tax=Sphingomonas oligophenolica TaxID=301154 RepID=A0ABU9YCA4_9SPHN
MPARLPDSIRFRNWLDFEWPFEIRERYSCGVTSYEIVADGCTVATLPLREAADEWVEKTRPVSMAVLVAEHRSLHPVEVTIDGGRAGRLARIPPELWATYDGLLLNATSSQVTIKSAKASAAFPNEIAVFVHIRRRPGRR